MLHTWQAGDVGAQEPYNGSFEKAMGAIKARTIVLPSATDLYFPYVLPSSCSQSPQANKPSRPEDSEIEVKNMAPGVGTLDVYPSIWGHWAGGPPGNMKDVEWLDERMAKLFGEGDGLSKQFEGVKVS